MGIMPGLANERELQIRPLARQRVERLHQHVHTFIR